MCFMGTGQDIDWAEEWQSDEVGSSLLFINYFHTSILVLMLRLCPYLFPDIDAKNYFLDILFLRYPNIIKITLIYI